ncbi:unnamed protein product [Lathyrus sativus]|nr:unnamed protein product [Lathyrus sativus]
MKMGDGLEGSLFVLFSKSQPDAFFDAKRRLSILSESRVKNVASVQCEPTEVLPSKYQYMASCSASNYCQDTL